ncbi:MAG: SpoIIIAH-like family protein [Bacilli bacterium]|jgi:stage III sporulation protein AH|nr:SpoIIIAH-like family protein [Bacilli bacterium]
MNRQNLWFLTLFSLILILGVYYITLPSDIFGESLNVNKDVSVVVSENDKLVALRVERNQNISSVMSELQDKINSEGISAEEKNNAFEELQILNLAKGKETYLEDKIKSEFKINSYVEINNDNINVTLSSSEHNSELANDIMRCIQEEFEDRKNIVIKFEGK